MTFTSLVSRSRAITAAALGCSALGDVFLAIEFEHHFIAGLGAFLAAHLFYMMVFVPSVNLRNRPLKILMCSLLLIYCLILAHQILPDDITLKVAVVIYIFVLSMMCCCAIFAAKNGVYLHVIGVLIFALSDFVIAWDAFRQTIPNASYWIMTSYYLAQAMIVLGIFTMCGYGNRSPREVTYN